MFKRTLIWAGGAVLACALTAAVPAHAESARRPPARDFNSDGYRDLVVGAPMAALNGHPAAGYVSVVYGGADGPDLSTAQNLSQDTPDVPDDGEDYDSFGNATAAADFNGDGFDDLAVAASGETTDAGSRAGMVTVFFGGPSGLGTPVAFTEPGGGGEDHYFGQSLAADDFDGDGRAELAITGGRSGNTYLASFGSEKAAPEKISALMDPRWAPVAAAAGDMTGDGYGDLLVSDAGGFLALYKGGPNGLGVRYPEYSDGDFEADDLAVGDINGDGRADVVAGVTTAASGGAIFVHYGTATGMTSGTEITQDTPGVPDASEDGADGVADQFGHAVAVGDVDGDGHADVAVGAPGEDLGSAANTGAVTFFRGGPKGVSLTGVQSWTQDSPGVAGASESDDRFGSAVTLIDNDKDGKADLAIGGSGESGTGSVLLLKGTASGVSATGSRAFGPASVGMPAEYGEFGSTLGH